MFGVLPLNLSIMSHRQSLALATLLLVGQANGQYQLEQTYAGASTGGPGQGKLQMVHLETLGDHFLLYQRADEEVQLMDLDHQLVMTISLAAADLDTTANGDHILYTTQHLFDTDDEVELLFVHMSGGYLDPAYGTYIINEDGGVLQFWPDEIPWVELGAPQEQVPIYNTSSGTKLLLSKSSTDEAKVYSLPGILSALTTEQTWSSVVSAPVRVYPNPTASEVMVELGWATRFNLASIEFLSASGAVVFEQAITRSVQHVDISPLAAGEYSYRIRVDARPVNAGKLIKQ